MRTNSWILSLIAVGFGAAACSASPVENGNRTSKGQPTAGTAAVTDVNGTPLPVGGGGSSLLPPAAGTPATTVSNAGGAGAMVTIPQGPISIDMTGSDNPAMLGAADVTKLMAGGPPGMLRWLYPYDGTVFPRGLLPPTLMWDGGTPDVVYLHIKSTYFEYKAVLKPTLDATTMAPQIVLPADVWAKAGAKTAGAGDPYSLELTGRIGGAIQGPITLHFNIAQATVKGSIYYNSYASKLPGAASGGNVLRIPAGGKVELFQSMQCNGCHSVSADGSRMLSQINLTNGGNSFQLLSGGAANPMGTAAGPRAAFGALYPDGSKYLSTSTAVPVGHADIAEPPGTAADAALYDTATGMVVPNTGVPTGALMPMFSPDGTRLAFNDNAIDAAHGLAVMDYDVKTNKASNYKMLTHEMAGGTLRPGWPFFLPDSKAVVFARTDSAEFSGNGAFIGAGSFAAFAGPFASFASAPVSGPVSELNLVDIASGTVTILAKAMGYATPADAASGKTYLAFTDEVHQNYFPTVAPIAAGGYFWVFFDSIRHYGNLGLQRQLWGAAIDIQANGSYALDPSHPAFYLPGQEFGAGNHRAFAALDPCKKDGDTCTSGIDCCGGTCTLGPAMEFVEPVGSCSPPMKNACAKRDERCTKDADCCPPTNGEPANTCIAGFCAFVMLN
jgi:hypothetical protein